MALLALVLTLVGVRTGLTVQDEDERIYVNTLRSMQDGDGYSAAVRYIVDRTGETVASAEEVAEAYYLRDNLPEKGDLRWLANGWKMFAGAHMPSGRFNAGEKAWFWIGVVVLCLVVSASGLIMLFPNFEQGRSLMQQANVIHAVAAILVMGLSLGHIYMGTIGVEGAYQNMRTGYTDETWAREHHENWYHEVKTRPGAGGAMSAARATAMKEGWKL